MKKILARFSPTAIELLIALTLCALILSVGLSVFRNSRATSRDDERKADVQSLAFKLETAHQLTGYYPESLSTQTISDVSKNDVFDPAGRELGQPGGEYSYTALGCTDGKCRKYTLRAILEKEAPYTKASLAQ